MWRGICREDGQHWEVVERQLIIPIQIGVPFREGLYSQYSDWLVCVRKALCLGMIFWPTPPPNAVHLRDMYRTLMNAVPDVAVFTLTEMACNERSYDHLKLDAYPPFTLQIFTTLNLDNLTRRHLPLGYRRRVQSTPSSVNLADQSGRQSPQAPTRISPSRTCSTVRRPSTPCPMLSASLPLQVVLLLVVLLFDSTSGWKRYEKRVLDCANVNATTCTMETPSGEKRSVSCRREPIPLAEQTKLNSNATHRLACPVGCKIHIVQQAHAVNRKCLSFSTFGKYFDVEAQDWYIWFCEPCQAVFSTNCEFEK